MKVKLSDIIEAIEMTSQDSEYFLDKETGKIIWCNAEVMEKDELEEVGEYLDEHDCCRLPTSYEIHDYSIMTEFTQNLSGENFDKLTVALRGRGAYRNFRNTIRYLGIEQQWYAYRDNAYKRIAIEWCNDNNIEYEE